MSKIDENQVVFFHVGITVESLTEAKAFFVDLFECRLISERTLTGDYLGRVLDETQIKHAKIALLEMKQGPILELVEYSVKENKSVFPIRQVGAVHLAHFVSNLDTFLELARNFEVEPVGSLTEIIPAGPYEGNRIVFLRTNFNVILEIIEE